jgi:hypothetical protein
MNFTGGSVNFASETGNVPWEVRMAARKAPEWEERNTLRTKEADISGAAHFINKSVWFSSCCLFHRKEACRASGDRKKLQ